MTESFPTCYLEFMGHTITVVFTKDRPVKNKKDKEKLDGYLDPSTETIYVWEGLPEDRKREILAHELIHLVDLDTSPRKTLSENQIGRISRGFQGLLADNPDLAVYFARKIKTATLVNRLGVCCATESDA